MAFQKGYRIRFQQPRGGYSFLLLSVVLVLDACSFPVQPRYQSLSESSVLSMPRQGYQDLEIGKHTYFVMYENYFSVSIKHGLWGDPLARKWLQGAQEYALYRAGELTKAKGGKYFTVLHKDDWNVIGRTEGRNSHAIIEPGAGLLLRISSHYPSTIQNDDGRVHDVDNLLQSLPKQNIGLAEYNGQPSDPAETMDANSRFIRWRSSIQAYDHTKVPSFKWFNGKFWEYGPFTDITRISANVFEITISSLSWISPLQMLWQSVEIAEQEGYQGFLLEDWTVEQYGTNAVWFRTKAKAILLRQVKPDSLLPEFEVEKIRPSVDTPDRFNRKYSGEVLKDVRFGNTPP